jgi:molybdopterin converting factor small subunit
MALRKKILMEVTVHFFGAQRTITNTRELQVNLTEDGRVSDVCLFLMDRYPDLPLNENEMLITVNNKTSSMNHILSPNDHITFLPHVGGG